MTQLSKEGTVEVFSLSELSEKINARKNTVLIFTGKEKIVYRVGITYSSGKYNIIFSYNDSSKWGQTVPGIKLPLIKKTTKEDVLDFLSEHMKRLGLKEKETLVIGSSLIEVGTDVQEVSFDDLEEQLKILREQKRERERKLEEANKFFNKFTIGSTLIDYFETPSKANFFLSQYIDEIIVSKYYEFNKKYDEKFVMGHNDDNDGMRAANDFFDNLSNKDFGVKTNNFYEFILSKDSREIEIKFKNPFYIKEIQNSKVQYRRVDSLKYEIDETSGNPYNVGDVDDKGNTVEGLVCPIRYTLIK